VCDKTLIPEPINKSKNLHSYLWYVVTATSRQEGPQNATLEQSGQPTGAKSLEQRVGNTATKAW
jgi:hypothetical protein